MPFIYTAASLLAKDPKTGEAVPWNPTPQRWIDGSVDNDIPITRLAEMFNVNHFIVSQVNPHVVPFLMKEEGIIGRNARELTDNATSPSWMDSLSHLAKGEALYRMHTLAELGIFPNLLTKTVSVLSQKYSGDITILPEISYADFPRMLSNPTKEFIQQAMLSGERATWPKISIIKNHCAIELALDDVVQKLRARVVFSPSEVESRLSAQVKRNSITGSQKTVRKKASKPRPLSHNSACEPLQSHGDLRHKNTTSLHTTHRGAGRITPVLRHKKSRSINTVLEPTRSPPLTPRAESTTAELFSTPRATPDVTSSGAEETSNLTSASSSTSLSLSSPAESSPSPAEDPPSKWHRPLFGSSSQSNTPSHSPTDTTSLPIPKLLSSALTMTPNQPRPEAKYKRLFQHRHSPSQTSSDFSRNSKQPSAANTISSGSDPARSTKRNWGLEIGIPSTAKGLVGKGKKKPPEM